MKKVKVIFILCLILLFSLFLRSFHLSSLPPGLSSDEVSFAYNAYTILEKGQDQFGKSYPLYFETFGEYKNPVPIYLLVPFLKIFGVNSFAIRLPMVILSVVSILLFYLLSKTLIKNTRTALLTSFLVSVSPWHFFFSRFSGGYIPGLTFLLAGLYFLFKSRKHISMLFFSVLCFTFSYYSYHSTKLVIFFLTPLIIFFPLHNLKNKILYGLSIAILIVGIVPSLLMYKQTFKRASMVSVFKNPFIEQQLVNDIHDFPTMSIPLPIIRLVTNKPIYYVKEFMSQLLYHFTPEYLIFKGDGDILFHFPNSGVLNTWTIIPLLASFIYLNKKKRIAAFLMYLWIISLLPSALSESLLSISSRSFLSSFPIYILIGVGVSQILRTFGFFRLILTILLIALSSYSTLTLIANYFYHFKTSSVVPWREKDKIVAEFIIKNQNRHKKILVDENLIIAEHFLFWNKLTGSEIKDMGWRVVRESDSYGFIHMSDLGNLSFRNSLTLNKNDLTENNLWIGTNRTMPKVPCPIVKEISKTSDQGITIVTLINNTEDNSENAVCLD